MQEINQQLHFSINTELIQNVAREKFYQQSDLAGALEIILSNKIQGLSPAQQLVTALKIINKTAAMSGVYPGDANIEIYDNNDISLDNICERILKLHKELEDIKEKQRTAFEKLVFIEENLDSDSKKYLNNLYEDFDDDPLFASVSDNTLCPRSASNTLLNSFLNRMTSNKGVSEDYGWLEPNGTFHPVAWSQHTEWAHDYLDEHFPFLDDKNAHLYSYQGQHIYDRDVLVYSLHWVLLHNPGQGIANVTSDPARELTEKQKEFLYNYYNERNLPDRAKNYL